MQPQRKSASLLARIRRVMHTLHPMERRLAEALLSFPGELASYSASELAKLANVSNATVSRFFRKLGYPNFEAARRNVRAEKQSGAALLLLGQTTETLHHVVEAHDAQAHLNLTRTFSGISITEVDTVAQSMLQARRVWVVGFRTSHAFATYLHWQILQAIEVAILLPTAGHTLAEHIAGIEPDDVVILFDFKRRPKFLDLVTRQIIARGPQMLIISDAPRTMQPNQVAWHFQCQTVAPGPLFNHVSVLAVSHLVATRVLELAGPSARKRLGTIEALHEELDESGSGFLLRTANDRSGAGSGHLNENPGFWAGCADRAGGGCAEVARGEAGRE